MSKSWINWKWPSTPANNYVPWYVVAWRCLWLPWALIGRLMFCGALTLSHGREEGRQAWRDTA